MLLYGPAQESYLPGAWRPPLQRSSRMACSVKMHSTSLFVHQPPGQETEELKRQGFQQAVTKGVLGQASSGQVCWRCGALACFCATSAHQSSSGHLTRHVSIIAEAQPCDLPWLQGTWVTLSRPGAKRAHDEGEAGVQVRRWQRWAHNHAQPLVRLQCMGCLCCSSLSTPPLNPALSPA